MTTLSLPALPPVSSPEAYVQAVNAIPMLTLEQVDTFIDDRDNEDARAIPLDKSALMQLFPRDGSKKAYGFTDLVIEDWRVKQGGRTERIMLSLSLTAGDMKKIQAI